MDVPTEQTLLLARDREWAAAALAGADADAIVSYRADHALVLPPGQPAVAGKAAIREYVSQSLHPGFSITWSPDDATVSADATLAHTSGTNHVTMSGEDGSTIELDGRVVTIRRRDSPDDEWRCAVDVGNAGPPQSPSAGGNAS